ncbi:MAG: hypothetical protein OXH45_12570 [Gammaproteobacteria bacterium]|nr:hypothetical protein [Gammaproteobacteria bacterium]
MNQSLSTQHHDLLFGVRKSVRYHEKREGFFTNVQNIASFVSILSSSAAALIITNFIATGWPALGKVLIPLAGALFSSISLAWRAPSRAAEHKSLKQRFISLERKLIACRRNPAEEDIENLTRERLLIEMEEPPVLEVLEAICYNEITHSMGLSRQSMVTVGRWQRAFSSLFDVRAEKLST